MKKTKPSKPAQLAAIRIYNDLQDGPPTPKGIKTIVLDIWARIIDEEMKK